jgi:CBS domain-containing protein
VHWGLTAGALMSAPAVTIYPEATIPHAGRLIGVVTRRDLLSVFLRPDDEIAVRARELLDDLLSADPGSVTATVRDGVVMLTGHPEEPECRELIPVAIRLIWDVDGVIDVLNRLDEQAAGDASVLTSPPASPS